MKKLIQAHQIAAFIAITLIYSWILWLLMILSAKDLLPFKFPTNFLGSFGPAVGALIVTGVCQGKTGLKNIFRSMVNWKVSAWAYLFAIFFILIVYLLSAAITYLFDPSLLKFGKMPGLSMTLIYFVIIAFVGGPLGEEIGWRGFLLPHLLKSYSPSGASLVIALIWLIWHIPLFWLEGAAQSGGSVIYFGISVFSMAFLFTLLYFRSNGSLLLAILFHTMINFVSAYILPQILPSSETNKTFGHVSTYLLLGFALLLLVIYKGYYGFGSFSTKKI